MISVTGDTDTGKHIARTAAEKVKRLHLELGGKAPVIVFDDADMEAVIENIKLFGYWNAGQDCTAACRVIAGPKIYDRFVADLADAVKTIKWGDPAEGDDIEMGSLIARGPGRQGRGDGRPGQVRRRDRDRRATGRTGRAPTTSRPSWPARTSAARSSRTRSSGRSSASSGSATRSRPSPGRTTCGSGSRRRSGPATRARAMRVAKAIQFGTVWINDHFMLVSEMPHGGFKESGYGKDQSMYAIEDYTVVKHVMLKI